MEYLKNNKIVIVSELYCGHINGSFIDCLDMYYNLKESGYNCDLIILVHLQYVKPLIKKLNQLYTNILSNDIVKHIHNNINNIKSDDIIICKYESIKSNLIDYTKFKNIYIINDWKLTADFINKTNLDIDSIDSIKGILATPFLFNYSQKVIIDYIKFNKFRLNNMRITTKLDTFDKYKDYDTLKQQAYFNIHNYAKLIYERRKLDGLSLCMEIKGKLIFEFLYFNKKVEYLPTNKSFDDGLTDYLQLFNINDNIKQELTISKEEIEEKLVFFRK